MALKVTKNTGLAPLPEIGVPYYNLHLLLYVRGGVAIFHYSSSNNNS